MIWWVLRRANVALGYALCRYDGSGGEDRANMKMSGSCGMCKLGLVGSVRRGRHYIHIPTGIEQILDHLWLKLFEVVHQNNELHALCTLI